MEKNQSQLRIGALLSYINLALGSALPFFYTPLMLGILGQAEYGLYSLATSTISHLSLLSFGFGSTILRYITMYRARGERQKEQEAFGFFLLLYGGMTVLVLLIGAIIFANVPAIFRQGLTTGEIAKMRSLVAMMTASSAVSFPVSVFYSVLIAHERYLFRKSLDILATILVPLGNLAALYLGFGSVGMAAVSVLIYLLMLPVNMIYCFKALNLRPKFTRMPASLLREILVFSAFVFISSIADLLFWSTDKVLLGMFASSAAVAVYNIGCTFNIMVQSVSTSISSVLTPHITAMVTTNAKKEQLTGLFLRVGRLQYLIVALIVSGFAVFGQAFLHLWAGDTFAHSYWIAIATLFPLCIPLIQSTGVSIITAQNRHRFHSVMYLVIAVVNVAATCLVIPRWGGLGAAVCSGVSYLLGHGLCMNLYYWRVTGIDIPLFWKNILRMSVLPAGMTAAGLLLSRVVSFGTWGVFFAGVAVYTALYCAIAYAAVMNAYEKDLIRSFAGKFLERLPLHKA